MSSLQERLRISRERKGYSQKEVFRRTKINNKTLSGYERGVSKPDYDSLYKLAELYSVSTDYLLYGDKSPIDNAYKLSDNSTYRDKVGQVNGLGADNLIPSGVVSVPVVASISCGEPAYTEDAIIGFVPMMTDFIHGDPLEYVYLRASGDSMTGADIKDGSFVLIHRQNTADNGDIVAVCVENENATLKRYLFDGMRVILTAENPKYPPLTYLPHEIRIVGRAMMVTKTL